MKILVVGNIAREHAICEALKKSPKHPQIIVYAAANNPGIAKLADKVEIGDLVDLEHLKTFAMGEQPDFAVVGPDDPIGAGAADALKSVGVPAVAPLKSLARIESSKSFARNLLNKYDIPGNPKYKIFFSEEGLAEFAAECGQFVVKFDGLAGGKGVKVMGDHFQTQAEGIAFALECLQTSGKVVLEEKLVGQEFSLLFFVDGESIVPMPAVQDNKRAFAGDKGPNTGGMGTVSDADHLLPFLTAEDIDQARKIATKTVGALQTECGEKYVGILYGGFMATASGVKLIEYNARFGDPEALNLLPLLASDFVDICQAMLSGTLAETPVEFLEQATVCKYIVPEGYPENPVKNVPVELNPSKIPEGVKTYFGSVDEQDSKLMLKGSRAIGFVGIADTIAEAQYLAEEATKAVSGPVTHREDIGTAKLLGERVEMMNSLRKQ